MAEKNKVMIKIEADIKDLQSSLKNVESSLKGLEKTTGAFDNIKNSLSGIGGTIASAFAVDKIKDFVGVAVEGASDLNSLNAQYEQVLGSMKGKADKYLNDISKKYNQHPNELKQSFTMYHAMLKGKGVAEKEAYELAKLYMERTADASAFGNYSMAQSTEYFMAMIKDEYDSLDNAMVFTSQTMMNEEATKVYGKKWDDLTVAQQEYLKTSVALKQHTDSGVLGQGIRESQEFGVVSERLKSTWDDLVASFGTPIMESLTPKLQAMTDAIDTERVKELATSFGEAVVKISALVPKILDLANQFSPLIGGIMATVGTMKTMETGAKAFDFVKNKGNILKTTFTALKNNTNGLKGAFKILQGVLKVPIFNPWALGVGVAVAMGILLYKNWDKIKEFALQLWDSLKTTFTQIGDFITDVWNTSVENTLSFFSELGTAISTGVSNVMEFFSTGFQKAVEVVSNVFDTIGNVIQVAIMFIAEIVRAGFMLVTLPIQFIWVNCGDFIMNVLNSIANFISSIISAIVSGIQGYLQLLWNYWSTVFTFIWNVVSTVFNNIRNVISNVLTAVWGCISNIWNGIVDFLSQVLSVIVSKVTDYFTRVKTKTTQIFNAVKSVATTVWNGIRTVVTNVCNSIKTVVIYVFTNVKNGITIIFNAIKSVATTVWNSIRGVCVSVADSIKSKVTNAFNGMKDSIKGVMDKIKSSVKNAWDSIKNIFSSVIRPNIKLPHFKISGKLSLNPPSVPKLDIDWYKTGGIFTGASVIGVGESGDEAVVPLSNKRRMKPFASAVASMIGDLPTRTESNSGGGVNINIAKMVVREDADIKKIAEELNKLTLRENRKKGLV